MSYFLPKAAFNSFVMREAVRSNEVGDESFGGA